MWFWVIYRPRGKAGDQRHVCIVSHTISARPARFSRVWKRGPPWRMRDLVFFLLVHMNLISDVLIKWFRKQRPRDKKIQEFVQCLCLFIEFLCACVGRMGGIHWRNFFLMSVSRQTSDTIVRRQWQMRKKSPEVSLICPAAGSCHF